MTTQWGWPHPEKGCVPRILFIRARLRLLHDIRNLKFRLNGMKPKQGGTRPTQEGLSQALAMTSRLDLIRAWSEPGQARNFQRP